jgi:iron(III) transport system ATP-binding protein
MSLNIQELNFRYKKNQSLIDNLSLTIPTGKVLAVVGKSGCGKTTLISLILGLLKPQSGLIKVSDRIFNDNQVFLATEARSIGVVFQDYALFPHLSVSQNITFGMKKTGKAKEELLISLLRMFDLANVSFFYPFQLSGGQMQRVAIARAIATEPTLLLLDEPFSNLDLALKTRLRKELMQIIRDLHITTLVVTHDKEDASFMADEILDLNVLFNR